jgi:hypothetical protein
MKYTGFLALLPLLLFGCKGNHSTETIKNETELKSAVCIYDGVPVKAEPGKDGKWLSSLSLGESITYLDDEYKDPEGKGQDYYKVELSDGKQAWARSYGICLKAKPAAIVAETPIYKRPELVTKTDKTFKTIEFVAVTGEKDDWVEIVGANKKKSGWVKSQYISTNPNDIAVATLAYKDLLDKDGNIITEKLASFIEKTKDENSKFSTYLNTLLDEQVSSKVEESINNNETDADAQSENQKTEESDGE